MKTLSVKRLAEEKWRQARVLHCQAQDELSLAPLQPRLEEMRARRCAFQKIDRANRLRRTAAQLTRAHQKANGPGGHPGPFKTFRPCVANGS